MFDNHRYLNALFSNCYGADEKKKLKPLLDANDP